MAAFLPFELIWAGGAAGRAAAQVGYWWTRRRDAAKARQAKRRAAAGRPVRDAPASAPWPQVAERAASGAEPSDPPATDTMQVPEVALPADPDLEVPTRRVAARRVPS